MLQYIQQMISNIETAFNSNFCCGLFGTILGIIIIPYFKKRMAIRSFIQYYCIKHRKSTKITNEKSIYDTLVTTCIMPHDHLEHFVEEIYKAGLVPSDVVHYINNRATIPLRISRDILTIKFPFNNNIVCILYKVRYYILVSILLIGIILMYKFE